MRFSFFSFLVTFSFFSTFVFLPFVSAYYYPSLYWLNPDYFFNMPEFRFGLAMIFFYAIIFFGTKNVFKENTAIAAIVSLVLSLILSYALWIRGYLDFYFNYNLFDGILMLALLIFVVLFAKFLYTSSSKYGSILALVAVWFAFFLIYTSDFYPVYSMPDGLNFFFEIITGKIGIAFLIIVVIFLLFRKEKDSHKKGYHFHLHDRD